MTIITPTGITGITSITSTGNTLQFQNASGADVSVSGLNVTSGTNINVSGIITASGGFSGNINSTGVSTFTNGPVFIGAATSTGTTSQRLQVTGGAYISGNLGVGITTPKGAIHLVDSSYRCLVISRSNTNSNSAGGAICGERYTKTNNPFVGVGVWDSGSVRKTYIGGGGWNSPETTEIGLYTAATYDETNDSALERLKIDSAGRVTMPYQPVFQAYGVSGGTYVNGNYWIFPSTLVNIGNHYNTSNGIFTAPIAGTYKFWWSFIGNTINDVYRYSLLKNNTSTNFQLRIDTISTGNEYGDNGSYTIAINLAANDTVRIYFSADAGNASYPGSNQSTDQFASFGGRLIG